MPAESQQGSRGGHPAVWGVLAITVTAAAAPGSQAVSQARRVSASCVGTQDHAHPVRAPSDASWVSIEPGTTIQPVVDGHPEGTTFYLRAGVHRRQHIKPKTNNSFVGEPGAVLDGENITPYAFEATTARPLNVTIRNLAITRYASPRQGGAIQGDNGIDWVVEGNAVHDNAYIGVRTGPGWHVRRNAVFRNGVIGISGYRADGILVEGNDIYQNNWSRARERPALAEASGIKLGQTANAVVRHNSVHHNFAKGIWIDHCNPATLIEANLVTDNSHQGIWAEISYKVTIRYNVSERNGFGGSGSWLTRAGIQVTNSPDVEICCNVVRDNTNGITAMQSSGAAATTGRFGPLRVERLHVHHNVIRLQVGRSGLAQNTGQTEVYGAWNNRIGHNTYCLGANASYFAWNEQSLTEWQWREAANDSTSTFIRWQSAARTPAGRGECD